MYHGPGDGPRPCALSSERCRLYDVAVIGAGPSGSWVATLLARCGARVVIVDGSHPREKPCGGGVTRRALDLVGPAASTLAGASVHVCRARFVDSTSGRESVVPLIDDHGSALVVTSRLDFDQRLLTVARDAGAELVPARASQVERASHGYTITVTPRPAVRARLLVGADGPTSLVRRRLATAFRRDQLSIATGYYAHGTTATDVVIELMSDPPGYVWSFPRVDHLAVGICAQADAGTTSAELRAKAAAWMRSTGIGLEARWTPYAWPIPSLSASDLADETMAGDDWCLIGDAAGLVDPITREGIYFALRSAALAADAIRAGDLGRYAMRVRVEVVAELRRAARLKAGFFTSPFTGLLVDALRESRAIRQVMAELITGEQRYRGLPWRLMRTGEVGLAGRLLAIKARGTLLGPSHARPGA